MEFFFCEGGKLSRSVAKLRRSSDAWEFLRKHAAMLPTMFFLADKDVTDPNGIQQSSVSARACCVAAYLIFSSGSFSTPSRVLDTCTGPASQPAALFLWHVMCFLFWSRSPAALAR